MSSGQRTDVEKLRQELNRLMSEHIDTLKALTFGGVDAEALREEDRRLKRIREVMTEFRRAVKNANHEEA